MRHEKEGVERRKTHPAMAVLHANECTQFAPLIPRRHGSDPGGDRSPSGAPRRRLPRRANARTQPRPRFTRTKRDTQALPVPSFALKRSTPRPGHAAGGDDARTARERGDKPRPQEPHSLRVQVCLEATPLTSEILCTVTEMETKVKEKGTGFLGEPAPGADIDVFFARSLRGGGRPAQARMRASARRAASRCSGLMCEATAFMAMPMIAASSAKTISGKFFGTR